MKKCPSCGEEIQDSAIKCRFCGEWLNENQLQQPQKINSSENIFMSSDKVKRIPIKNKGQLSHKFSNAPRGKRLLNLLLDYVFIFAFGFIIGIILGILGLGDIIENANDTVLGLIIMFSYFLLFEGIRGKTVAKFITKTKVINEKGETPNFLGICGRTLCRFIPFEVFSFLGNSNPRGRHDSLSNTYVIEDK